MKHSLPVLFILLNVSFASGQKIYTSEQDIFTIKELTFYGYDFSDWRLAETKRVGEDMRVYIMSWIDLMKRKMTSDRLLHWYVKDNVTPNFAPTDERAKQIKPQHLVVSIKHYIASDSVQFFINAYKLTEKEGIGLVMIVECFDKESSRTSGYFAFFDIATRKILQLEYVDQKEVDGYGLTNYWGVSLNGVTSNHASSYRKRLDTGRRKYFWNK